ncbi:MAG: ADOP family duplicated permease [Terriglobia bacterium]
MFWRKRKQSDFTAEIEAHLELETERLKEQGLSGEEARRAARRNFGNVTRAQERFYESGRWLWWDHLVQDLRFGLRVLRKNPGFTAVAVITIALGIGANTAIFSLLNAIMLRELPVRRPQQLVLFGTGSAAGNTDLFASTELYSYPFYRQMRQKNQVFSDLSAELSFLFTKMHGAVGEGAELEPMDVQLVSGSYFSCLGVKPILGRSFTEAEDAPAGGHPVAIVSYSWWNRRFGRDPATVGRTLTLGSTVYTIIGITPAGFFGATVGESPDLWIPLSMEKQVQPGWTRLEDKSFESLYILGRLKPGVSAGQAQANVNLLARQIWQGYAGVTLTKQEQEDLQRTQIQLTSIARGVPHLRDATSMPLQILMAVVGMVLLIVCANIANLLLARATTREREIAVRMSLGAGRARLIRQMLTENLLLALSGGALGVALAWWAGNGLLAMVPHGADPLPVNVAPDARVLGFTFMVSLATALLCGIAPALRATRIALTASLKEGRGAISVASRTPLAKALIVSQVALSLVLLIGAGLFLRSLANLASVDTGFNKEKVLLFGIDPPAVGYKEDLRVVSLYQQIEQRVSALPGVRAASISFLTFNQGAWTNKVSVIGHTPTSDDDMVATHNVVGPGYFATMGIPLLLGRVFGPQDTGASPKVVVVNETFARRYFPGSSPIGRHFGLAVDPKHSNDIEVVGVVKDAKYQGLRDRPVPAAYYPYAQKVQYLNDFEVRYTGNPEVIIPEVRQAIGQVDRGLPVAYQGTMVQQVNRSMAGQTLIARLSTFFGLLAAFLACIGIYGLMSYAVTRRTNEIGIRMALGAENSGVLWMVMRESLMLVAIGVAIGIPAALAASRLVSSVLYGLKATDPITIAMSALVMIAVAALAGYLPARRAARVDPMVALRHE